MLFFVLSACLSDHTFVPVDGRDTGEAPPSGGPGGEEPGEGWNPPGFGELQDSFAVIAWSEHPPLVADGPSWTWEPNDPVSYAIIDLTGQTFVEWNAEDLGYGEYFRHVAIEPAGSGDFDIVIEASEVYAADSVTSGSGFRWVSFRADGVEETLTRTMTETIHTQPWEGPQAQGWFAHVDATEQQVLLGPQDAVTHLHLGAWQTEPDRAVLWTSSDACGTEPGTMLSVDLFDEDEVDAWTPIAEPAATWAFQARTSRDDEDFALFGVRDCAATEHEVVFWHADDGEVWRQALPSAARQQRVRMSPNDGGAALSVSLDDEEWVLAGPDGVTTGALSEDSFDHRPGPVVRAEDETFVMLANDGEADLLEVYYRGQVVHTVDSIRFGIGDAERVFIRDIIALPR